MARKFCKKNFISYLRMREWRDIYSQLQDVVKEMGASQSGASPEISGGDDARFEAIHRSILTGLWSNVARSKERNFYQLSGNRDVMVFPGFRLV